MADWTWTLTETPDVYLGMQEHVASGALITVRRIIDSDVEEEEWSWAMEMKRGEVTTVAFSDQFYCTADGAMRAAEALFNDEGRLIDAEAVFRTAFATKTQI